MKATGLFFLRMHATVATAPSGERIVLLPVLERDEHDYKIVLNQLLVKWKGPEAVAFFEAHQAELRAGRPLLLELDRLRGQDREWHATATRCELAPVARSWQVHADQQQQRAEPATP